MKIEHIGKVVIREDGIDVIEFSFNAEGEYVSDPMHSSKELALRWALRRLKEAMWQEGMRNL